MLERFWTITAIAICTASQQLAIESREKCGAEANGISEVAWIVLAQGESPSWHDDEAADAEAKKTNEGKRSTKRESPKNELDSKEEEFLTGLGMSDEKKAVPKILRRVR